MNTIHTTGARFAALLFISLFCSTTFASSTKVEVCHIPPDDPENFHTLTISAKALPSHLEHGDLGAACNAVCATLCDDGNKCTIDDGAVDCEQNGCPVDLEPVDCNDQNDCTADSCNPATGCVNNPRLGETCDDGILCTGPDTCNAEGVCSGAAIDNCCLSDADCSGSLCDRAECNPTSNRCGNDPVICDTSNLCNVSACNVSDGECVETPIVCGDGLECNPASGECEQVIACPCFDQSTLQGLGTVDPSRCGNNFPRAGIAAVFYTNGNFACSGSGCATNGNPGCGYRKSGVLSQIGPITADQDTACRALIVNSCPSSAASAEVSENRAVEEYSSPLLSDK